MCIFLATDDEDTRKKFQSWFPHDQQNNGMCDYVSETDTVSVRQTAWRAMCDV